MKTLIFFFEYFSSADTFVRTLILENTCGIITIQHSDGAVMKYRYIKNHPENEAVQKVMIPKCKVEVKNLTQNDINEVIAGLQRTTPSQVT